MKGLINECVIPKLRSRNKDENTLVHRTVRTHGMGESFLAEIIKDWEDRNRLNFFDVNPKPTKEQIRHSWLVNSLDLATTIYALETMDNVREGNFILGEQPEVAEVIALKLIVLPLIHQNSNTHQMVWFNAVVTAAVVNNLYVINRYD